MKNEIGNSSGGKMLISLSTFGVNVFFMTQGANYGPSAQQWKVVNSKSRGEESAFRTERGRQPK